MPVKRPPARSTSPTDLIDPAGVFSHHSSALAASANQNTMEKKSRPPWSYVSGVSQSR
jgi:hypothetical protein